MVDAIIFLHDNCACRTKLKYPCRRLANIVTFFSQERERERVSFSLGCLWPSDLPKPIVYCICIFIVLIAVVGDHVILLSFMLIIIAGYLPAPIFVCAVLLCVCSCCSIAEMNDVMTFNGINFLRKVVVAWMWSVQKKIETVFFSSMWRIFAPQLDWVSWRFVMHNDSKLHRANSFCQTVC